MLRLRDNDPIKRLAVVVKVEAGLAGDSAPLLSQRFSAVWQV